MKKIMTGLAAVGILVAAVFAYRAYLINQLQDLVAAELSDPASAQFRNIRLFSDWTPSGSAMCGEVNAKNQMGGYVGFRNFVAMQGYVNLNDDFRQKFKKQHGLSECSFEEVAPWWHLR